MSLKARGVMSEVPNFRKISKAPNDSSIGSSIIKVPSQFKSSINRSMWDDLPSPNTEGVKSQAVKVNYPH